MIFLNKLSCDFSDVDREMNKSFLSSPFKIGGVELPHRLLQGPLAGFSAAPMRVLFHDFISPAYAVSEMISAQDVIYKHTASSRYLYRSPKEKYLCYQLAGHSPLILAEAAVRLEQQGADLIDLNCGCPKSKIRKKGAGSALLDTPQELCQIVATIKKAISIPLTVKCRIFGDERDKVLAKSLENAGADALIIHGRHWTNDYDTPCNLQQIRAIKQHISIPVIANGDITDLLKLQAAMTITGCDAYMISRAGCGNPWLFQQLLGHEMVVTMRIKIHYFMAHLHGLAELENEHQAVLQSKALVRYYFRNMRPVPKFFYALKSLQAIETYLRQCVSLRQSSVTTIGG